MYRYKTTWTKGMNTRPQPNVNNNPNGTVAYNVTVDGVEVWTAPADGVNVRKNDMWMRLDDPIVKWVAIIHMGVVYGILTETTVDPEPTPDTVPAFPQSFTLTNPDGSKAEYVFVRVIE